MAKHSETHLSRRERQIMDILHARGAATAAEVLESLPSPPSYSAVRALLRIMEQKGYVTHSEEGARYVYVPVISRENASRSALQRVVSTFFNGSVSQAVAALLETADTRLSAEEIHKIQQSIAKAKKEGR